MLKWVVERLEGTADAVDTPVGQVPSLDAIDTAGLELTSEQLTEALAVDAEQWRVEIQRIGEWFDHIGDKTPAALRQELSTLKARLQA